MSSWESFKKHITAKRVIAILFSTAIIAGVVLGTIGSADLLLKLRIAPTIPEDAVYDRWNRNSQDDPEELANYQAVVIFTLMWTGAGIFIGFVARSWYLTSRDTDLWDMGDIELSRTIGAFEDEQRRRKETAKESKDPKEFGRPVRRVERKEQGSKPPAGDDSAGEDVQKPAVSGVSG